MRTQRQLLDGVSYHVSARVNRGEQYLCMPYARDLFLDTLEECRLRFGFVLDACALRDDLVELIISPLHGADLPAIMRWMLGTFGSRFNRRFAVKGHVWADRYRSTPLTTLSDYLTLRARISKAPLYARIAASEWQWASGTLHRTQIRKPSHCQTPRV